MSAPSGLKTNTVSFTETPKSGKDMTSARSGQTDHISRIKSKLPLAKAKQQQLSTPGGATNSRLQNGRDMSSTANASPLASRSTDRQTVIPANTPTLRAHDILVDQLVEAVMDSHQVLDVGRYSSGEDRIPTPTNLNLNDPASALDTGAFLSRDKLDRSPIYLKTSSQSIVEVSPNKGSSTTLEKIIVYESCSLTDVQSNRIESTSGIQHADIIHVEEDYLLSKSSDVSNNQYIQQEDVRTLSFDDISIISNQNAQSPLLPDPIYGLETSGKSNAYSPIFSPAFGLNSVSTENESDSESVKTPTDKILSPVIFNNTNNHNSSLAIDSQNNYNDFHSTQYANPFLVGSNDSSANSTLKGSSSNTTLQNDYVANASIIKTPSLVDVDDLFQTNTPIIHAKSQSTKLSSLDSLLSQVKFPLIEDLPSPLLLQSGSPISIQKGNEDLQSPLLLQSGSPISIQMGNDFVSSNGRILDKPSVNNSFSGIMDEHDVDLLSGVMDEHAVDLLSGVMDENDVDLLSGVMDEHDVDLLSGVMDEHDVDLLSGVMDENDVDLLTLSMKTDIYKDNLQDSDEDYEHLLKRRPIHSIGLDDEDGLLKEFDFFSPRKFGLRVEGQSPWKKAVSSNSARRANGITAANIGPNRINANELIAKYSRLKMNESETGRIPLAPSGEKPHLSRSVTEDDGYLIPLKVSGPSENVSVRTSRQDPLKTTLDDIFGEDDSILLPPSPVNDDFLL